MSVSDVLSVDLDGEPDDNDREGLARSFTAALAAFA